VRAVGTDLGPIDLGDVTLLPPTVTLQYHFNTSERVKPYVGAGVNYTTFFNDDLPSGSILAGIATPTEAAAVGAVGAVILGLLRRALGTARLREVMRGTVRLTSMVFMILIGASVFSLVFRGLGGDTLVHEALTDLPGGRNGALVLVMLALFLLGFIIDFIEITYIVVPIVAPALLAMGVDPVWLGVMIAVNLQTSFLTPPFGFALFYLRGVAPAAVSTADIYRGVLPFVLLQLLMLLVLAMWPALATWLPAVVYAN